MSVELSKPTGESIDKIGRIDRVRILAASYSPLNPRFFAPHFLKGEILESLPEDEYNRRMIPSREVRRNLLFAGAEDVDELRGLVEDRIVLLTGQFANGTEVGFNPETSFACLDFVTKAMEQMPNRRTGEEAVAHVYRIALGVLDVVDLYRRLDQKNGGDYGRLPFRLNGKGLEYLLLMGILHDFPEDRMFDPQFGEKRPIGTIETRRKPDHSQVLLLKRFQPNGVTEEIEIKGELNDFDIISLDQSLRSLDTGHIDNGDEALTALEAAIDGITRQEHLHGPDVIRQVAIPIIKIIDRGENLHTYTFRLKEGCSFDVDDDRCFEANPLNSNHSLLDKARETANHFVYPEFLFAVLLQDKSLLNAAFYQGLSNLTRAIPLATRFTLPVLANPYIQDISLCRALFRKEIAAFRPTALAGLVTSGLSQDEIYGKGEKGRFALPDQRILMV